MTEHDVGSHHPVSYTQVCVHGNRDARVFKYGNYFHYIHTHKQGIGLNRQRSLGVG